VCSLPRTPPAGPRTGCGSSSCTDSPSTPGYRTDLGSGDMEGLS
jgi:hypothetical protein